MTTANVQLKMSFLYDLCEPTAQMTRTTAIATYY